MDWKLKAMYIFDLIMAFCPVLGIALIFWQPNLRQQLFITSPFVIGFLTYELYEFKNTTKKKKDDAIKDIATL